jgi:hypothetical protein
MHTVRSRHEYRRAGPFDLGHPIKDIAVASLLQQLQGDETLLLMYLVAELPKAERAEVERRLAVDANLRVQLDCLTQAHDLFTSGLEALDAATPVTADVSAAVRRASGAIRQWQARPPQAMAERVQRRPAGRWHVWAIPAAAAAIVLVVLGISLYSDSRSNGRVAKVPASVLSGSSSKSDGLSLTRGLSIVVPPPVNPPADEVIDLLAMTTPTAGNAEIDTLPDVGGPASDRDLPRDETYGKTPHDDGAVFDIPLDEGQ